MKRILFVIFIVIGISFWGCQSKTHDKNKQSNTVKNIHNVKNKKAIPVMTFEQTVYNFGEMTQGEIAKYDFVFKNTGNAPLLISSVRTTCGCTVTDFPKMPIEPGKKGVIKVVFNSAYKEGFQNKKILIHANTNPKDLVLAVKANVNIPENN